MSAVAAGCRRPRYSQRCPPRLGAGLVITVVNHFALNGTKQALHRGIVPAVACSAHADLNSVSCQDPAVLVGCILDPTIGMVHEIGRWLSVRERHLECVDCQRSRETILKRPAYNHSREQVHQHGQVPPPLSRSNVGDIRHPGLVGLGSAEPPLEQIGSYGPAWLRLGRNSELAPDLRSDPVAAHQTSYPVSTTAPALSLQLRMDARAAVDLSSLQHGSYRYPRADVGSPTSRALSGLLRQE